MSVFPAIKSVGDVVSLANGLSYIWLGDRWKVDRVTGGGSGTGEYRMVSEELVLDGTGKAKLSYRPEGHLVSKMVHVHTNEGMIVYQSGITIDGTDWFVEVSSLYAGHTITADYLAKIEV